MGTMQKLNMPNVDMPPDAETIEHAKAGYANAQDVIRFLDTKTGAVMGLVTLSIGLPMLFGQWLAGLGEGSQFSLRALMAGSRLLCEISAGIAGLGFTAGAVALLYCLHGLNARTPFGRGKVPILFPMFDPTGKTNAAHRSFARLRRKITNEEIIAEYEMQLRRTGSILHEKMRCLRFAVRCVEFQIVAYFFALISLVCIKFF